MMEIVDAKGKLSSGILCLYVTKGGSMLYSECAIEDGESYVFDAAKTAVVTVMQRPDGKTAYHIEKATGQFGGPTKLIVPKSALAMVQDISDMALLQNARSTLSGLILPNK